MLNTELVRIPNSDYYIFGYCYIPLSPHRRVRVHFFSLLILELQKDWEKFDTPDGATAVKRVYRLDGYITSSGKYIEMKIKADVAATGAFLSTTLPPNGHQIAYNLTWKACGANRQSHQSGQFGWCTLRLITHVSTFSRADRTLEVWRCSSKSRAHSP